MINRLRAVENHRAASCGCEQRTIRVLIKKSTVPWIFNGYHRLEPWRRAFPEQSPLERARISIIQIDVGNHWRNRQFRIEFCLHDDRQWNSRGDFSRIE